MADDKSHLWPRFKQEIQKLDELRSENFWQTFPELANLK